MFLILCRYVEYGEYNGNLYGTTVDEVRSIINSTRVCILCPNIQVWNVFTLYRFKFRSVSLYSDTFYLWTSTNARNWFTDFPSERRRHFNLAVMILKRLNCNIWSAAGFGSWSQKVHPVRWKSLNYLRSTGWIIDETWEAKPFQKYAEIVETRLRCALRRVQ